MTPDLRLLSGFARGVSLSLHVRVTCLHSGSWLLSGFIIRKGTEVWGGLGAAACTQGCRGGTPRFDTHGLFPLLRLNRTMLVPPDLGMISS